MCLSPLSRFFRHPACQAGALVACLIAWGALPLACDHDQPAGPVAGEPLDNLPQISAALLALSADVEGAGVHLRWIWSDRNPYPAMEIERRVEGRDQHAVVAGPFRYPVSDWVDGDVVTGGTYAYRVRCLDAQQVAVAVAPWDTVMIGDEPIFTVNGGAPVTGAVPVPADLLATTAAAMRIAWGPDAAPEPWQPVRRSLLLVPPGSGSYTVICQVRYADSTTSAPLPASFVLDLDDPLASFVIEVLPDTRRVLVDASPSGDQDNLCPPEALSFTWAWGDGEESARGAQTSAVHTYVEPGRRQITLTVTDWAGHTAQVSREADLPNRAPNMAQLLAPEDGASDVSRLPLFQWSGCTDPERDAVTYNLYLGTTDPLPVVATGFMAASWCPTAPLAAQTDYRWQVVAIDAWGDQTPSAAAGFQTAANSAPAIADEPYPANWQERVSAWPRLSWSACIDPEGEVVSYDLYFGNVLPTELLAEGLQEPFYQLDPLLHGTTYFWRVVARDPEAAQSTSRTWRFKTGAAPSVTMAALRNGSFVMGSAAAASGGVGNPAHTVDLSRPIWLGTHEVTNAQYADMLLRAWARRLVQCDGEQIVAHGQLLADLTMPECRLEWRGQGFGITAGYEQHPVVGVTWCGAAAFCDWMNDLEGLPQAYDVNDGSAGAWALAAGSPLATVGYRLPSEAEWEYASQFSGARAYPWGDEAPSCAQANLAGCHGGPVAVGFYPAAPSLADGGLHDLAGNVAEWCHDWWQEDLSAADQVDPAGPAAGTRKVLRGGGFDALPDELKCSWRDGQDPATGSSATGFRLARTGGY